ncbi:MAG: hypothetical protein V1793_10490 [Pseudomonadota bacterium]
MNLVVCIDDTDNLESQGTGHLAQHIADTIEDMGWGSCSLITRHQLYVHEDIPYTSHNSAMCFEARIQADDREMLIAYCMKTLKTMSAPGSDPGLCVAVRREIRDPGRLIDFGLRAKQTVLTKDMAYSLARDMEIHLSEHGGTGGGVIGALAGTGLRLHGNDGRYRGWYHFGLAGTVVPVQELCSHRFIDRIQTRDGRILEQDQQVSLGGDTVKTIHRDGLQVVIVDEIQPVNGNPRWVTLTKEAVKLL